MQWYLIDQSGKIWDSVASFVQEYHGNGNSPAHVDFLVRNLGCIAVQSNRSHTLVRAAPRKTSYATYSALVQWLDDRDVTRIGFSWYDSDWYSEIVFGASALADKLLRQMSTNRCPERFHKRNRMPDCPNLSKTHKSLIELWKFGGGTLDIRKHHDTIFNLTEAKFLTVFRDPDQSQLKFSQFGPAWVIYDNKHWLHHCINKRVEHQPDYEYGCWIANTYREAILIDRPSLLDIDAVIQDPTGGGSRRLQYTRLTLPVIGLDGREQLLSTPFLNSAIDLRLPVN